MPFDFLIFQKCHENFRYFKKKIANSDNSELKKFTNNFQPKPNCENGYGWRLLWYESVNL